MISEGSCDTEDWSKDAENSALITEINYILNCIQIRKLFNFYISKYCSFYCIFGQINAVLLNYSSENSEKCITVSTKI